MDALNQHPSYLELDRHVLGVAREPATGEHVAHCARCQAHLQRVAATDLVPAWVAPLESSRSRRWGRWLAAISGMAAAAVALLLWLQPPAYDTVKGAPAVAVYVNRQGVVSLWSGAALRPGDQIRLEVAPQQFRYVSVFLEEAGGPTPLYRGPVQAQVHTILPKAWQLDAQANAERIAVLFSERMLAPDAALAALRQPRAPVVRITLPKQAR